MSTLPLRREWRWSELRPSFDVKINFILGLGLAILVAVGTLAFRSIETLVDTGRTEAQTYARLGRLEAFLGSMRNTIAAQRKYLLTGNKTELLSYSQARGNTTRELDALRADTVDGEQLLQLTQLQSLVRNRLRVLEAAIIARVRGDTATPLQLIVAPATEALDRQMEILATDLRMRELHLLQARRSETVISADTSSFLITWGTAFACALLAWAMVNIHRNQVARREAERTVRESEAQLRLITDSVPALIGYVNRDGRLLFQNRTFERWFGHPAGNIFSSSFRDLFGEESFRVMQPHIAAVLQGKPVDFNFSFATPRDGLKDLSAQLVPHREESGNVSGFYALVTDITALTEVERIKSEFVATVSHELRTPLTSIRGSLGLLAGGVTGALPDKARNLVTIAMQNCERLVRLINDILDSERMMSGKMQFKMEPLDLAAIIERCMLETESFAAANGVRLHYTPQQTCPPVRADRDRLSQVITNLFSNACKFSSSGSTVEVSSSLNGNLARVEVADRGPGVPASMAPRLFERFMQVDGSNLRRQSGTGLGLAICKGMIERMDGRIGYAPRDGGGSIFYFELPIWREAPVKNEQ